MKHRILLLLCLVGSLAARAQVKDTVTFAVMGNSISTYYDYLPSGYAVYYGLSRELKNGIQVGDTWWMQLSRTSGMTFLVNSSWSGSRVACDALNAIHPFVSNERVVSLGRAGVPDAVIIAGGTNDWNQGKVPLGEYSTVVFNDSVTFRGAYAMLLHKIQTRYPGMKIICLSIFPRGNSATEKNAQGWTQNDASTSIKQIAKQFGAYFVDCSRIAFSSSWSTYTLDYLHPTTAGHKLIADCITSSLRQQGVITSALKGNNEVSEAPCLLDLSFDASGMVNNGTQKSMVGRRGRASILYDATNDTYYGCTKAANSDFFYATYDAESPLALALNQNVTWEVLVRLDGLANGAGSCEKVCFLSSEQDGGWSFYNSRYASTFSYSHQSGVKSTLKCLAGDSIMVPGRFYHMVVTMDRRSHVMRYFVNGQLVATGTRCGTDMPMPRIGSIAGKKNMWLCLGGDPVSGTYSTQVENGAAATFVFARIYEGALSQRAALALYDDRVKRFTEPQQPIGDDFLLDCHFTPDGAQNVASSFLDRPVEMVGTVPTAYNPDIHAYEATFAGDKKTFLKYDLGTIPAAMKAMGNAYSLEIYCQSASARPTNTIRPASFPNGYGVALQMNAQGNVGYTTTTQGYKADDTYARTQWSWLGTGTLTDAYTHYVITYDRLQGLSALYVDGELADSRTLTNKECPIYEWAPAEWLAIGGDASGNYDISTSLGSYPFRGRVGRVRLWSRALTASAVRSLHSLGKQTSYTLVTGNNGYAALCLPFPTIVPEGLVAYKLVEVSTSTAYLEPVAEAGDRLPYGAAVIVMGDKRREYTFHLAEPTTPFGQEADMSRNLLVGVMADKEVKAGDGYFQNTTGNYLYRITSGRTLPAGTCYLPSSLTRTYLTYQKLETPIALPQADAQGATRGGDDAIYDLQGRRTAAPLPHTLYINKGHKVMRR